MMVPFQHLPDLPQRLQSIIFPNDASLQRPVMLLQAPQQQLLDQFLVRHFRQLAGDVKLVQLLFPAGEPLAQLG